jgi:hypothetical protein
MRATYKAIAHAIAACVVLQATWIALSTFILIGDLDDGKVIDKNYDGNFANSLHGIFGMLVIPLLAIALLIVSFLAKIPGGSKWAGFVFLAVVCQILLGFFSFAVPALGALHGINAFIVLGLSLYAGRRIAGAPSVTVQPESATV